MENLVIVYGSSSGHTKEVADKIFSKLKDSYNVSIFDIKTLTEDQLEKINSANYVIFGTSTWGIGDLQDDWDIYDFNKINVENKKVAIFGLGDCIVFSFTFCDAIKKMYDILTNKKAVVVGSFENCGYTFDKSESFIDDKFLGLALDIDNFPDIVDQNIDNWIQKLKLEFN
ncbi:flavodoxin domain-containing protein [Malacoplasma iowae]|uniref:Flavodoxin n=1 Tax=Malacoplasma iowae DK-CPA TaxID=1394179 RepID=A0A084U401_MALIO|nr:flavodoxin domain-containing protein [Malacoplasma iowae]KFB07687.1 flavodoxin [Malacoplasma iowae DK-CPA]WPL36519.1 flavodoxin domain-containing protein [Malacoplasma iowae]WPL38316.1 flavodoxin domain-containing protein [Malacoplasma iowae]WPL40296.1 flavodoxin domain-containing protein [Malacoplasma iowae]WPL41138.1 flavodoxin domain-containing protein [Malacoplasma iowae]